MHSSSTCTCRTIFCLSSPSGTAITRVLKHESRRQQTTMQQQVVLLASSTESIISAWDLHTGTQLSSFKNNASPKNALCLAGADYIVAAQSSKDAIQFWTWHKDQVLQRSFAMERMTALAVSLDGCLLAAGGMSGALYIWELASGRLLRNWPAHYKAVTTLAFSGCGCVLLSGSEDTLVSAWLLTELLDAQPDPSSQAAMRPQPLHSWSDHTLPVTGLYCSKAGSAGAGLVVSSSMDRTVKIHSLGDGALLAAAQLPCAATCVTLDAGEHAMYVGGSDGMVYEVALVGEVADLEAQATLGSQQALSGARTDGAGPSNTLGLEVHGAVLRPHARFQGHTRAINSLAVSWEGELLVSGSEDGTAQVWDLRSRQAIRVLQAPSKLPVSSVLVLPHPPHLTAGGGGGSSSGARVGPRRLAPLAPLVKYAGMSGNLKPWESAAVILDGSSAFEPVSELQGVLLPPPTGSEQAWLQEEEDQQDSMETWYGDTQGVNQSVQVTLTEGIGGAGVGAGQGGSQGEVARLKDELAAAQKEAQTWKALHAQLHSFCVQNVLHAGEG